MISSIKYQVKQALRQKFKDYKNKYSEQQMKKRVVPEEETRHNINNQMIFKQFRLTADGYEVN